MSKVIHVLFCVYVYLSPAAFCATFHELERVFFHLIKVSPQWYEHVKETYDELDSQTLVQVLHCSIVDGRVLGELTTEFGRIDYKGLANSNIYITQFQKYMNIPDEDTVFFQDNIIYLDYIIQLLLRETQPSISQSSQSPADCLEELILTERAYVVKLLKLYYYIERLKVKNPSNVKMIDSIVGGISDLTEEHQLMSLSLEFESESLEDRVVEFFYVFTSKMEPIYTRWIQSRCDDLQTLRPILNLRSPAPFSNALDPVDTLLAFMLAPIQRLCKYPLLLDEISRKTKNPKFDVLRSRMQQLTLRLNNQRKTADVHHKIVDWHRIWDTLHDQYITEMETVKISWERGTLKTRLFCQYNSGYLLLKEHNDSYYIGGLVLYDDIVDFQVTSENQILITFQENKNARTNRCWSLSILFEKPVSEEWYDAYVVNNR